MEKVRANETRVAKEEDGWGREEQIVVEREGTETLRHM